MADASIKSCDQALYKTKKGTLPGKGRSAHEVFFVTGIARPR
jgi:hypothetical protein